MCCENEIPEYPAAVAQMLAMARNRLRSPESWGADAWNSAVATRPLRHVGPRGDSALEALWASYTDQRGPTIQEVAAVVQRAVQVSEVPGLVLLSVGDGEPAWVVPDWPEVVEGAEVDVAVFVTCTASDPVEVTIGTDTVILQEGQYALLEAKLVGSAVGIDAAISGVSCQSPAVLTRVAGGLLHLSSPTVVRWTVVGEDGRAHFPLGSVQRWDVHGRGFFHLQQGEVAVPPGNYRVRAVRGFEFWPFEAEISVHAGTNATVLAELERRFDPHGKGWWSADLHVHANYGGEYAISSDDAIVMQRGEGLDFMNLVAANQLSDHVHDIGLFKAALHHQLPGSHESPAHAGIEYRNDLYGHAHITGAQRDIGYYQTGHAQGAVNVDWPLNNEALNAYQAVGATTGYCHPVFPDWGGVSDNILERVMGRKDPRTSEARCAVLDAALGVVDSLDVLSNADDLASAELYRHMVGAGMRVAATAGSDTMLSMRQLGVHSNPPGWVRLYARTGHDITLSSLQDAVRHGRTIATNGPWIEFDVDGRGPGDDLICEEPLTVTVTVRVTVDGPCTVRLFRCSQLAYEWHVMSGEAQHGWTGSIALDVPMSEALMVEVVGTADPLALDDIAYAHTSPVHIMMAGRSVSRAADVDWCLTWLDRLRDFVAQNGRGIHERMGDFGAALVEASGRLISRDAR